MKFVNIAPILVLVVSVAIDWFGVTIGWWWLALLPGIIIGIVLHGFWRTFLVSLLAGLLGWGLPLFTLVFIGAPLYHTAAIIEAIMGLQGGNGMIVISITLLLGIILSLVGTWVGTALRSVLTLSRFQAHSWSKQE